MEELTVIIIQPEEHLTGTSIQLWPMAIVHILMDPPDPKLGGKWIWLKNTEYIALSSIIGRAVSIASRYVPSISHQFHPSLLLWCVCCVCEREREREREREGVCLSERVC